MDLIAEIGQSPLYTLHSHTQFCDGHAPMEEFAAAAAAAGFAVYGFTPHSPIPIESPCNMSKDSVPLYLDEVKSLQALYPAVHFLAGMEIDYLGDDWGASNTYFKELPLDFTISSIHFIPTQDGELIDIDGRFERFKENMSTRFHSDIRYVVDTFFNQTQKMLDAGHFDIIGHFDKIKHNGGLYHPGLEDEPWYKERVNEVVDSIIASKVIVEINTKAWQQHQQLFPSQRLWRRLTDASVPIIVNSDAHYPSLINASRPEVLKALAYLRDKQASAKS